MLILNKRSGVADSDVVKRHYLVYYAQKVVELEAQCPSIAFLISKTWYKAYKEILKESTEDVDKNVPNLVI